MRQLLSMILLLSWLAAPTVWAAKKDPQSLVKERIAAGQFDDLRWELARLLVAKAPPGNVGPEKALDAAANDPGYRAGLAAHEVLRQCNPQTLKEIAGLPGGTVFLQEFFTNAAWLRGLLCCGEIKGPIDGCIYTLYCIWKLDPACVDDKLWSRVAAAFALQCPGTYEPKVTTRYPAARRYQLYKQAYARGELNGNFATLPTWLLRSAIELGGDDSYYDFLLHERHQKMEDYYNACWVCPYLCYNVYNLDVQAPGYHAPWEHRFNPAENAVRTGGVCGMLSTYGSWSAKAHGVPAFTCNQPGHCAYIARGRPDRWGIGYAVTWPTTPFFFWFGSGTWTYILMTDEIFADPQVYYRSCVHLWQAELYRTWAPCQFRAPFRYLAYAGQWDRLPDFAKLVPVKTGTAASFDLAAVRPQPDAFGIVWNGKLDVGRPGKYTFQLGSDDGSRLSIDNKIAINNDGCHGMAPRTAVVELKQGEHDFKLEYFDKEGTDGLAIEIPSTVLSAETQAAYHLATTVHPANYGAWAAWGAAMRQATDTPIDAWREYANGVALGLINHQEPAWQLLMDYPGEAVLKQMKTTAEKVNFFLAFHQRLRQSSAHLFPDWPFEDWPFERLLNRQADCLGGDIEAQLQLLRGSLAAHASSPANGRYFARTLEWGQGRFAANPQAAEKFLKALQEVILAQGDKSDPAIFRNTILGMITTAETSGQAPLFNTATDLAHRVFKPDPQGGIYLNADQATKLPQPDGFPGQVLSEKAMINFSSRDGADTPMFHRALLRPGKPGGFFHTGGENNPWTTITLPGPAVLSGIVIINRYEAAPERAVPLRVSVSEDGQTWQAVFETDKSEPAWRIDLQAKPIKAKLIKVEARHPEKQAAVLHLRGIHVYGKPLY